MALEMRPLNENTMDFVAWNGQSLLFQGCNWVIFFYFCLMEALLWSPRGGLEFRVLTALTCGQPEVTQSDIPHLLDYLQENKTIAESLYVGLINSQRSLRD